MFLGYYAVFQLQCANNASQCSLCRILSSTVSTSSRSMSSASSPACRTSCFVRSDRLISLQGCRSFHHVPVQIRWSCARRSWSRPAPFGSAKLSACFFCREQCLESWPYLHDTICLLRILILLDIFFERWEWTTLRPDITAERASRIPAQELINNLPQQLMCHQCRILLIANYDARDALGSCVCVESVRLLFDILSLAGAGAFGNCPREERHELADARAGEAGV